MRNISLSHQVTFAQENYVFIFNNSRRYSLAWSLIEKKGVRQIWRHIAQVDESNHMSTFYRHAARLRFVFCIYFKSMQKPVHEVAGCNFCLVRYFHMNETKCFISNVCLCFKLSLIRKNTGPRAKIFHPAIKIDYSDTENGPAQFLRSNGHTDLSKIGLRVRRWRRQFWAYSVSWYITVFE